MLAPRDYQVDAMEAIDAAEKAGVRRPLVVHPTGTGKTVTFAHALVRRRERDGTRGAVFVHREELAEQAIKKLRMIAPELSIGLVKATSNELDADVLVCSVPTVSQDARLAQLVESHKRNPFGMLVADEAHHAPAPSWTKTLTALGAFSPHGPLTVGFTATPERDGKSLGVWERVVSYMSIREAIYGGFLVPVPPAVVVETKVDMTKVRKTAGDYSDGDLGRELENAGAIEQIADAYVEHASDRKGLAFLPTVATAHHLARELCKRGIAAEALDGGTDKKLRPAILERLASGKTQVVTNCAVLTEGFDEPSISCVVVARPTKSHGLYIQMIGRGTRCSPGKTDLMILDIVGASHRHELVTRADLDLDNEDPRKSKRGESEEPGKGYRCAACGGPCQEPEVHLCKLCCRPLPASVIYAGGSRHETCRADRTERVDVFGKSRLRWLPVDNGWCLGAGKEVVIMAPVGLNTWRLAAYENNRLKVLHDALPSDWAMGIGEDRAKAFQKLVERDARWLSLPVSDPQKTSLIREGLPESKLSRLANRGEASDLLTRIKGRRGMRKLTA